MVIVTSANSTLGDIPALVHTVETKFMQRFELDKAKN